VSRSFRDKTKLATGDVIVGDRTLRSCVFSYRHTANVLTYVRRELMSEERTADVPNMSLAPTSLGTLSDNSLCPLGPPRLKHMLGTNLDV